MSSTVTLTLIRNVRILPNCLHEIIIEDVKSLIWRDRFNDVLTQLVVRSNLHAVFDELEYIWYLLDMGAFNIQVLLDRIFHYYSNTQDHIDCGWMLFAIRRLKYSRF